MGRPRLKWATEAANALWETRKERNAIRLDLNLRTHQNQIISLAQEIVNKGKRGCSNVNTEPVPQDGARPAGTRFGPHGDEIPQTPPRTPQGTPAPSSPTDFGPHGHEIPETPPRRSDNYTINFRAGGNL